VVLYLAWRMVVSDIEKYVSKMLAKMVAIFLNKTPEYSGSPFN